MATASIPSIIPLKYLADSLALHGIASLRYDKRGIGASKAATKGEQELRFDDYISDVTGWIHLLDADKRFRRDCYIRP